MTSLSLGERALLRTLACTLPWAGRWFLFHDADAPSWAMMAYDLALVGAHWWATTPLREGDEAKKPARRSWTYFLWTPLFIAAYLTLRDLWFVANGFSF